MKTQFFHASGQKRRARITTLIVAGATGLITLGAGLTWTATADPGVDEKQQPTIAAPTVNLDSLYAAKADEGHSRDTSFIDMTEPTRTIQGHVSWYGARFHGRRTANGERYDMHGMSAAHKTLPFNTLVRVEDSKTGRAVLVRVNDRGPYVRNRVLDLSGEAAGRLGIKGRGMADGIIEIFPEHEARRTVRTVSTNGGAADEKIRFTTFDALLKGVRPNGWSVQVARLESFNDAVTLHNELLNDYEQVFLTRIVSGDKTEYCISLGLFDSELLGGDLLIELGDQFNESRVVRFEQGLPIARQNTDMTDRS